MNSWLLHFPNPHFELLWNRRHIDCVPFTMAEAVGTEFAALDYL